MLSSVEHEKSLITLETDVEKLPSLYVMPRHTKKTSISFLTVGGNVNYVIINYRRNWGQRDTCIKGLFWQPLEPKTENCF